MANQLFDFGLIGLGVMGRNLLLNMADHGFAVMGYNRSPQKVTELESEIVPGTTVKGTSDLKVMANALKLPRRIMMLVQAGKPVDDVLNELIPFLDKGDIIIDGGNSHYTDTLRRVQYMQEKGFHFMGMGVSGGEEGARRGPSIMPGGDPEAYQHVKPMLEAVSAKVNGEPCVAHLGKGAAGHYVKMVHNGIEYGIMQLISEVYDVLHRGYGLSNDELHEVFKQWNEGELQSFLVEITRDIFLKDDDKTGKRLVDVILDKAGSKGTGKWTSQDAMDLGIAIPTIDIAVSMRNLSALKQERVNAAAVYPSGIKITGVSKEDIIQQAREALFFGTMISYAQGLALLFVASKEYDMDIPLPQVVKIWRGGCIIRSTLLEVFYQAYSSNPDLSNILLDSHIAALLKSREANTRKFTGTAVQAGIPVSALAVSLGYFDAYRSAVMPTNLIQAQRDFFGAHTYQRVDEEGIFHSNWQ
ncbi:NADP-dependent phosphogluconate dehydrogenase [Agriterribacter sp.]|uniref:NADP-dependent phosphogluconate dehydrogenase n=1 Tax=Agriterribacter sp. TaxID=2821509 RepID=UPI002BA66C73|nr:NADP-dependent phosphogluconate dehydrogenase [Agriterribacter sp.]HTN06079.1 NADP-dependent phosphogluconate dehydrogenase [Agriterribacter sp.]